MKQLICEMCGNNDLIKQDGYFVCQFCHTKYSVEEAKKIMIEGTVDVKGTVQVDTSVLQKKYLENARRALAKEDWEEVEKYYNLVEQSDPKNIEAIFFSSYGRAMLSLLDDEYYKREQKFKVFGKSISVIDDYFDQNNNQKNTLNAISQALFKMFSTQFVCHNQTTPFVGTRRWQVNIFKNTNKIFIEELKNIYKLHPQLSYIADMITKHQKFKFPGCYVATCVYNSYDCSQVWTLRRYRDNVLGVTWYGKLFIRLYYAISPTLVAWFGEKKWFKKFLKRKLDKMVQKLQCNGIESTPYQDKIW